MKSKKHFLILAVIGLCLICAVGVKSQPAKNSKELLNNLYSSVNDKQKIAYTVNIPARVNPDGSILPSVTYNIPLLSSDNYIINAIYIKTKSRHQIGLDAQSVNSYELMASLNNLDVKKVASPFANSEANIVNNDDNFGLDRIYEIHYSSGTDPYDVCRELMNNPEIEYAVPIFRRYVYEHTPNDPYLSRQWAVNTIEAKKAWEVSKGSAKVIIGIVDTGVDWEHEDLTDNIWTNPGEIPDNEVDDDNNGFIDDVHGWAFVGDITLSEAINGQYKPNNDVKNAAQGHGTSVAGCASAVSNNLKGIAGIGYSCIILPVKCASSNAATNGIWDGYNGIKYAADNGAKIINCSWGGPGFSLVEQEVINYAVSKGAVVIAASGNDGLNIEDGGQYPAGYKNVVTVGSSDANDKVSTFSNYGKTLAVYAPGERIYTTIPGNQYDYIDGTSFSSPIVAGIAGLVLANHLDWLTPAKPEYTMKRIYHQIRNTSDNVLTTDPSLRPTYYGRANANNAVSLEVPGLEISEFHIQTGDTLKQYDTPTTVTFTLTNYLATANDVTIKISPLCDYISLDQPILNIGTVNSLESKTFDVSVKLLQSNPWFIGTADLLITLGSGTIVDYQYVQLPIKVPSTNQFYRINFSGNNKFNFYSGAAIGENSLWAIGEMPISPELSIGVFLHLDPDQSKSFFSFNPDPMELFYSIYAFDGTKAFAGSDAERIQGTEAKVYKTIDGGKNWISQSVASYTTRVNNIYFFDNNNGVFLGNPINNKWGIGITNDGGTTWSPIQFNLSTISTDEKGIAGSAFWTDKYGWFGTTKGRVFRSISSGKNWEPVTINNAASVYLFGFTTPQKGIAIYSESSASGASRYVASTTDGGLSWNTKVYDFGSKRIFPVYCYVPKLSDNIYIVCSNGDVYWTGDNGTTWLPVLSQKEANTSGGAGFVFPNGQILLWGLGQGLSGLVFNPPVITKKEFTLTSENPMNYDTVKVNGGLSKNVTIKNTGNTVITITECTLVPESGTNVDEFKIVGVPPTQVSVGNDLTLRVRFAPTTTGLKKATLHVKSDAITNDIAVQVLGYSKEPSSVPGTEENTSNTYFDPCSPNPCSDEINVAFNINKPDNIELIITNYLGENLFTVYNGIIDAGKSSFNIRTDKLSSGIYYFKLNTSQGIFTQPFVVNQ